MCPKEGIANLSQKPLPRFGIQKDGLWLLAGSWRPGWHLKPNSSHLFPKETWGTPLGLLQVCKAAPSQSEPAGVPAAPPPALEVVPPA